MGLVQLVFLLGSMALPVKAQEIPVHWYGTADGLADLRITALAQDARGFLWIGSHGGLDRFDGREFVSFDHAAITGGVSVEIGQVENLELKQNQLIVTTTTSIVTIHLGAHADDRVTGIRARTAAPVPTPPDPPNPTSRSSPDGVRPVAPHPGRGGGPDAARREGKGSASAQNAAAHKRRSGSDSLSLSGRMSSPGTMASSDRLHPMLVDREGNFWRGTPAGLALTVPGRSWILRSGRRLPDGMQGVSCFAQDPGGAIWIGMRHGGAVRLPVEDVDGEGWPVPDGQRNGDGVERLTRQNGLPSDDVRAVLALGPDYLLIGTAAGLAVRNGGRMHVFTTAQGLPSDDIRCIVRARGGGVWIGTAEGLVRWDGEHLRTFTTWDGLPSNGVQCLAVDPFGEIWIGTDRGACALRTTPQQRIRQISESGQTAVTSILIDREGRPWLASADGVLHFSRDGVLKLRKRDGLAGRRVVFIAEDSAGTMYFGTNAGISVLSRTNLQWFITIAGTQRFIPLAPVQRLFHRETAMHALTSANGLAGSEMMPNASMLDSTGALWLGSVDGATRWQPTLHRPTPAALLLAGLQIGDTAVPPSTDATVSAGECVFAVRCILPSFRNPGQVRYYFRLEGLEYRWHASDDGRMLWTALPAGTYRVLVRATIGEGIWAAETALVTVHVEGSVMESSWIIALGFVLAAAAGWLLARRYQTSRRSS